MKTKLIATSANGEHGHPWKQHEADFQRWIALVTSDEPVKQTELDAVVRQFYLTVVRSATRIISSPSFRWLRLSGEDIANSWYLDLVATKLRGYDRSRPFYCYGYKLLFRKCLNIRRHEKYRQVQKGGERVGLEDRPDRVAEVRESIGRLRKILPGLSAAERSAMDRKYVDQEPSKTIAPDFGKSVGGFNRWTFDLRNRLRNLLGDERESA